MPVQPEVRPAPAPEVRPTPTPQVHIARPRPAPGQAATSIEPTEKATEQPPIQVEKAAPATAPTSAVTRPQSQFVPARPWQPRVVQGAAGRLVEIGAFGTVPQAKLGWRYMVRAYPAMSHLPAVVRPDRNSKGRSFYRFRVGTTSQAHSEILCQRMQRIGLSCAVVGLPWKAKVER